MSSIDERIVALQLRNSQFTKAAGDSLGVLQKLKQGLNMDSAKASLAGLQRTAGSFTLGSIGDGASMVQAKVSALGIAGVAALAGIASQAVATGQALISSVTTDPIMDGFNEYELKMGSIQTILSNTAKAGTTLDQVKGSLEELNTYADKTIYNFGDMTRNIGLFTNAGIGLEDATSMIKGFSNEAATSGTTSAQAAGAAYQLSQALNAGTIRLMDWRSLQNVGMGNKNMQDGVLDLAAAMGTLESAGISSEEVTADFNGSLEKGWLSADVMSNYLKIMAGDMDAAGMAALGLTDAQIEMFTAQAQRGEEAATKVRTWTQLMGTLQEAVGSGWAQTFEYLLGDFDKATEFFTYVNDTIGPLVTAAGNERNNLLSEWEYLGGRTAVIDSLKNVFEALMAVIGPIKEAFREIFPPMTSIQLRDITFAIRDFTAGLIPSGATMEKVKTIFKGLFAILSIGVSIVKGIFGVFVSLFQAIAGASGGGGGLLDFAAGIAEWLISVDEAIKKGTAFTGFFNAIGAAIAWVVGLFSTLIGAVVAFATGMEMPDFSGVLSIFDNLGARLGRIGDFFSGIIGAVAEWTAPAREAIGKFFDNLFGKGAEDASKQSAAKGAPAAKNAMLEKITEMIDGIGDWMANADWGWIWDAFSAGLGVGFLLAVKNVLSRFGGIADMITSGGGFLDIFRKGLTGVFDGMTGTFSAMQTKIKADALIKIAIAIGILALSVLVLSLIEPSRLASSVAGIAAMMGELIAALVMLEKFTTAVGFLGAMKLPFLIAMLIGLGIALNLVAFAMLMLSSLSWEELAKGIVGITGAMAVLVASAKMLSKASPQMIAGAAGIIVMAIALHVMVGAIKKMGDLSWDQLIKGLTGLGGVLAAVLAFIKIAKIDAQTAMSAIGLAGIAASVAILAEAVGAFGKLDPNQLIQGLLGTAAALGLMAIFLKVVPNPALFYQTAIGLLLLSGAIWIIAQAVSTFANLGPEKLAMGMGAFALTLLAISRATAAMPANMPVVAAGILIIGAAMYVIAGALALLGGISLESMVVALIGMGGALLILGLAVQAMQGSIVGAAAVAIVSVALLALASAMSILGSLSWDQVAVGLVAMAAALAILIVAGYAAMPASAGLIVLSIALLAMGAAMLMAGIGIFLITTGLALFIGALVALAAVGAAGAAGIAAVFTALIALIPAALVAIAQGIIGFAQVIITSGPTLIAAFVTVLGSMITAIATTAPLLINTIKDMLLQLIAALTEVIPPLIEFAVLFITTLVNALIVLIPMLVDAGLQIITGILEGIASNIQGIVEAGMDIVINFLNGIAAKIPELIQSAINLVISFIEGLAQGIRDNTDRVNAAAGDLADAIIDGLVQGVMGGIDAVANAARDLANGAIQAATNLFQVNSPSKVFRSIGYSVGEGLEDGLHGSQQGVVSETEALGNASIKAMKLTMDRMDEMIHSDLDAQPTITPVLDMSNIKKGASGIGAMLDAAKVNVATQNGYNRASMVARDYRGLPAYAGFSEEAPTTVINETNFSYEQHNTSPRAIPSTELYRQTNNQISQVREALKKR